MPRGIVGGKVGQIGATPTSAFGSIEFDYTGSAQSWIVPAGIVSIVVTVLGSSGSDQWVTGTGGKGARVVTTLSVTPLSNLAIYVGGMGQVGTSGGGWNGGGHGRTWGGGGGGASDIRQNGISLASRVVVAGGGGGAGRVDFSPSLRGGDAGEYGQSGGGTGGGGEGASLTAGGNLGGTLGNGGSAINNVYTGGGGGGFYGGGAGRSGSNNGGGGRSSMSTGSSTIITDGYNIGHGNIRIEWG